MISDGVESIDFIDFIDLVLENREYYTISANSDLPGSFYHNTFPCQENIQRKSSQLFSRINMCPAAADYSYSAVFSQPRMKRFEPRLCV